ncbi:hypothetical protein ACHAQJ_001388 [Trichoderma viride]
MADFITTNSRTAVASTAITSSEFRVYFQDANNGIYEAKYNGTWSFSKNPLFSVKRSSHIAAVSWNNEIRIFGVSKDGLLQEWQSSNGGGWTISSGGATSLKVQVAPTSSITATSWDSGRNIRLYLQEDNGSNAIQELSWNHNSSSSWTRGATLPDADVGSHLSTTSWGSGTSASIRVFYQTSDLSIREYSKDGNNQWYQGPFNVNAALKNSGITATSWASGGANIQVYWQDPTGVLIGKEVRGQEVGTASWTDAGVTVSIPVGTHLSVINLGNGASVKIFYQSLAGDIAEECNDGAGWHSEKVPVVPA